MKKIAILFLALLLIVPFALAQQAVKINGNGINNKISITASEFELSLNEQKEVVEGLFVTLVSVTDTNCTAEEGTYCIQVMESATIKIEVPEKNILDEVTLQKGEVKEIEETGTIKLLHVEENSATFKFVPIIAVYPALIGKGNIKVMPSLRYNLNALINSTDINLNIDLNEIAGKHINKLVINPIKKQIMTEIKTGTGNILKAVPQMAMQRVNARIMSINGFADINIVLEDDNRWVMRTQFRDMNIGAEIEIDGNSIYINTPKMKKKLTVLPEQASEIAKQKANMHTVHAVNMTTEGTPVYQVKGMQKGKFFGLFPTEIEVETEIDIENGKIIRQKGPWWSFLIVPDLPNGE